MIEDHPSQFQMDRAATILGRLLSAPGQVGRYKPHTSLVASSVVADVYEEKGPYLNGESMHRPHDVVVAGYAVAQALRTSQLNEADMIGFYIALGEIMGHLKRTHRYYAFRKADEELMQECLDCLNELEEHPALARLINTQEQSTD